MIDKGLEHEKKEKMFHRYGARGRETDRNYNVCHLKSCGWIFFLFSFFLFLFSRLFILGRKFYSSTTNWGRTLKIPAELSPAPSNRPSLSRLLNSRLTQDGEKKVKSENSLSDIMPENNRSSSLYHILNAHRSFLYCVGVGGRR